MSNKLITLQDDKLIINLKELSPMESDCIRENKDRLALSGYILSMGLG